jgi:hypothetical protein
VAAVLRWMAMKATSTTVDSGPRWLIRKVERTRVVVLAVARMMTARRAKKRAELVMTISSPPLLNHCSRSGVAAILFGEIRWATEATTSCCLSACS